MSNVYRHGTYMTCDTSWVLLLVEVISRSFSSNEEGLLLVYSKIVPLRRQWRYQEAASFYEGESVQGPRLECVDVRAYMFQRPCTLGGTRKRASLGTMDSGRGQDHFDY